MINLEDRFYTYVNENYLECQEREILAFVKDVCQQVLELAAENAFALPVYDRDILTDECIVNKQSILDTINQVK